MTIDAAGNGFPRGGIQTLESLRKRKLGSGRKLHKLRVLSDNARRAIQLSLKMRLAPNRGESSALRVHLYALQTYFLLEH